MKGGKRRMERKEKEKSTGTLEDLRRGISLLTGSPPSYKEYEVPAKRLTAPPRR